MSFYRDNRPELTFLAIILATLASWGALVGTLLAFVAGSQK